MRQRLPSRSIDTIVRPIDKFARDPSGRPLKAVKEDGAIRLVGVADQNELVPADSPSGLYWVVTPLLAHDSVDFDLLRDRLRSRSRVAMGVVAKARPGTGAVLLTPTAQGFALHAIDRSNPAGPFERLFSQRRMTLLVDDWADRIVPDGPELPGGDGGRANTRTEIGGQLVVRPAPSQRRR